MDLVCGRVRDRAGDAALARPVERRTWAAWRQGPTFCWTGADGIGCHRVKVRRDDDGTKEGTSMRSDVMDEVATILRQAAAEAILPGYRKLLAGEVEKTSGEIGRAH